MIQESRERNKIVVIVVDPWTLRLSCSCYSQVMRQYDSLDFFNCSLLVVLNREDQETKMGIPTLEAKIGETFPTKTTVDSPVFRRDNIGTMTELRTEIADALRKVRQRIIEVSDRVREVKGQGPRTSPTISAEGGL